MGMRTYRGVTLVLLFSPFLCPFPFLPSQLCLPAALLRVAFIHPVAQLHCLAALQHHPKHLVHVETSLGDLTLAQQPKSYHKAWAEPLNCLKSPSLCSSE